MGNRYIEVREQIKTGDVLFIEGRGAFSRLIRAMTAQSYSHVAIAFWVEGGGLWVAEMLMSKGFHLTPMSQWSRLMGEWWWGRAPEQVVRSDKIMPFIRKYRDTDPDYDFWMLPLVRLGEWFPKLSPRGNICSTLVQSAWEQTGYKFGVSEIMTPGELKNYCDSVMMVRHY